jgi:hypothetical protein
MMLLLPFVALAHDIPNDVRVQAFVEPSGERLNLLVRVPLAAMNEVDVPRRGPGYLDLARAEPALRQAASLWIADNIEIYEGDARLRAPRIVDVRVSLPSDKSFASYDAALAHVTGPRLPEEMELYWNQQLLDVLLQYAIVSDRSTFSIEPRLARLGLRVVTALQFLPPAGASRAFEFHGNPGLVRLDPRWHQAALRFVELGFLHILDGTDHLLFILCLVIPFRKLRPLIVLVTSFTVAHSITLIASAFALAPTALWFPPLIETMIAMSIVYMALENIVGSNIQRRWIITFAFGLVHGFGFSFVLGETLQFAGSHLLTALFSFNIGVELGQLLVVLLLVPTLDLLFRFVVAGRLATIILSALVAHTAWHWTTERAERLSQFPWPKLDAATVAAAMRWLILVLVLESHSGSSTFGFGETDGWSRKRKRRAETPTVDRRITCRRHPTSVSSRGQGQELLQVLLPHHGHGMRAVSARLRAQGDDDRPPPRHALDLALQDAELRWIDEVVGGIHRHQRHLDFFQVGTGIVVTRRLELIQRVVRIGRLHRRFDCRVQRRIALGEGRHRLLAQGRIAGHEMQHLDRGAQARRLRGIVAATPIRIAPDGVDNDAAPDAIAP